MTSAEPTTHAPTPRPAPGPDVLLAATVAVLGHFDGDADQTLTVWQDGSARTVRVSTDATAVSATLVEATRAGLLAAEPAPSPDAGRLVDLTGDCPAPADLDLLVRLDDARRTVHVATGPAWARTATAERLSGLIQRVAGHLADPATADAPLSRLPFLTADERTRLVVELNDTTAEVPPRTVAQAIADLAAEDPDAPAVITRERVLSRRELQDLARTVAGQLARAGVREGDSVYVCLPRSAELVVAWTAALGAGIVCVPVDPAYPQARIQQIVQGESPTVLTVPSTHDLIPHARRIPVVLDPPAGSPAPDGAWPVAAAPESVVYVMHTSGSTGVPKGVAIREIGLRNLMHVSARQFGLGPGRRSLSLASPGFDANVWELLAPLYAGAAVVPFDDELISAKGLAECVRATEADAFFPFSPLLIRLDPADFPGIRTVITAGELFSQELVDRWQPGREMIYAFGPTEATALQSWHYCHAGSPEPAPSIGRPMTNLRMWLVDPWGGLAAPGAVGELYIGGLGVGAGYVGLPEATAAKFVVRPELDGDSTLYRTGDLASFRPDGAIDFRGRKDNQVKLRGFRVELGEVETVLAALPGIDTAISVVHETDAERLLVAHLIPVPGTELPSPAHLREQLADLLPYYMIPSAFVALTDIPYTPNGKIDRTVLARRPLPAPSEPATGSGDMADREILAEVSAAFAVVLGVPDIAPDQDFFAAGGHSLGVAEIAGRLNDHYRTDIRARDLFEHPTPADLTRRIAQLLATTEGAAADAEPDSDEGGPGLLPVQSWQWLLRQARPEDDAAYNVPTLFTCGGAVDPERLRVALKALRLRHPMLQATVREVNGAPQVSLDGPEPALEVVDLSEAADPEADCAEAVRRRANLPIDLAAGPALRATLLRLPGGHHRLLTVCHHIVSDGPGIDILARDLVAAYEGTADALPPLTRDPLAVGRTESQLLAQGAFDGQLDHWREVLTPPPAALPLPVDNPRVRPAGARTATVEVELGAQLTGSLREIGRQARTGLAAPLAAAVAVALSHSTGHKDICLGTPVNLRGELGLTEHLTNGANSTVLRLRMGAGSLAELLADVAEQMHAAIDYARVPFPHVVDRLAMPITPLRNALFDVFVTCYRRSEAGTAPGLTLSGQVVPLDSGLCDLSFQGCEHRDGLTLILQYDSDLYDEDTALLFLDRWRLAVTALATEPEAPWSRPGLGTPAAAQAPAVAGFGGFRFDTATGEGGEG
ncbi:non-ribosomal peptide synthetase [Streptomyces sp. TLI_146]|uniref:non-ribosomal peptide synthetase n=1 Tax=Streptomyces sp. TLI_146 TaxID=1938858 RepID=UPI000CC114B3|nr:non-ribosomal peptide synthetase [Streptomyces sp. TLI_146]PKV84121.1 amino acid adenylation domain-containing protein [Streptomyces sp. TLI_146]